MNRKWYQCKEGCCSHPPTTLNPCPQPQLLLMDNKSPEGGGVGGRQGRVWEWVRESAREESGWKKSFDSREWEIHMMKIMWVRGTKNNKGEENGSTTGCRLASCRRSEKEREKHVLAGRAGQPCIPENKGVLEFFPTASLSSSSPSSYCFMTISWPLFLSTPSLPECIILYNHRASWETVQARFLV